MGVLSGKQEKDSKYIFVGDHLEQLFTLEKTYIDFIRQITPILTSKHKVTFLFCIREDYLPQLFTLSRYIPEIYERDNTYKLFKLDKVNGIDIFSKASELSHVKLTSEFIERVVNDLYIECEGSIFPPYLQIVGRKIYENINKNLKTKWNNQTTHEMYSSLDGVNKVVSDYLSSLLDKYKNEEKLQVGQILSTMVTQYYTKKRVNHNYLIDELPNIRKLDYFLNSLIKDRIIKRSFDEYELAHDFLAQKIIELISENKYLSPIVRQAIWFVEKNFFDKNLTVIDISKYVGVTANHLSAILKKELNTGINSFLNEYRVNKAKDLLKNTREPLKNIADKVGFKSQNTFSRTFKKHTETTPKDYRKEKIEFTCFPD